MIVSRNLQALECNFIGLNCSLEKKNNNNNENKYFYIGRYVINNNTDLRHENQIQK